MELCYGNFHTIVPLKSVVS